MWGYGRHPAVEARYTLLRVLLLLPSSPSRLCLSSSPSNGILSGIKSAHHVTVTAGTRAARLGAMEPSTVDDCSLEAKILRWTNAMAVWW